MSSSRSTRRLRKQIAEPGLRAAIAADVHVVIATSSTSSSRSTVHVEQVGSAGPPTTASPTPGPEPKETP